MDGSRNGGSDNSELVKKILTGARWSSYLRMLAQAISWLTTIIVVRYISPEEYGLNAMLEAPRELLLLVSTFGLDVALTRAAALNRAEVKSAFGWLLLINLVIFLVYNLLASAVAQYFGEPDLELMSRVLSITFLLLPFRAIPNALLARELQFKLVSSAELLAGVVTAVFTLAAALMGAGIWALIGGVLINRVVLTIVLTIKRPWFFWPTLDLKAIQGLAVFGGLTTFWAGLVLLAEKLPSLIAGPRLGVEVLGIYAVAIQFASLPLGKIMPVINPIIFPAFSRFKEQPVDAAIYFQKMLGYLLILIFPVMVGLAGVAQTFVPTVLGSQWGELVVPLAILSLAMPIRLLTSIMRPVASSMGRIDVAVKSALFWFLISIPMVYLGGLYGINGLVIGVVVAEIASAFYTSRIFMPIFKLRLVAVLRTAWPAVICSLVMLVFVQLVMYFSPEVHVAVLLIIQILVGCLVYLVLLRLVFPDSFYGLWGLILGR